MAKLTCPQCGNALSSVARFCERCGTVAPTQGVPDDEEELQPIRIGDVVEGKWRIESKLGAGGMGTVYLAHDLALDRKVAIKTMAPALCKNSEFMTRFEREAQATARLEHPNIVPVYAVGRHFGRPFLVMKNLVGESLTRWLKRRLANAQKPGREDVLSLLRQLCSGLAFIHASGFIHRDLKPGNVFVGTDGHVTILDFGVLRDTGSGQRMMLTRVGDPVGTPHFMAPEQALGARDIDARADLYSLGAVLYQILAGVPPFDGPTPMEVLHLHVKAPPPDIRTVASHVPPAVARVIQRSLAKKPAERYASATEFLAAVEAAWPPDDATQPIEAIAPSADVEADGPGEPETISPAGRADGVEDRTHPVPQLADDRQGSRQRRVLLWAAGGLGVAALAVALVAGTGKLARSPEEGPSPASPMPSPPPLGDEAERTGASAPLAAADSDEPEEAEEAAEALVDGGAAPGVGDGGAGIPRGSLLKKVLKGESTGLLPDRPGEKRKHP